MRTRVSSSFVECALASAFVSGDSALEMSCEVRHTPAQLYYPVTVCDMVLWLRPLAQNLLPKLRFYSLIILGESGKGKTGLASTLGTALARMRVAIFNAEGTSLL